MVGKHDQKRYKKTNMYIQLEQAQMVPPGEEKFFRSPSPSFETPQMFQHHHNRKLAHSGSKLARR